MTRPSYHPAPGDGVLAHLAAWALRLIRWRVVLAQPLPARAVVVIYPHTSNWDFPVGLLAKWALARRFRWVAKDTLFANPLGPLLVRLGGIPVNRRERTGFAASMREAFACNDEMLLVIAPEATRSRVEHWKSGFYHIARAAAVPVGLAFIDWSQREIGFAGFVELTGAEDADMQRIAAAYAGRVGRNPEQQGPIRLRGGR